MTEIPTGDTMEVVFDRMNRASNFASNGVYMITHGHRDITAAQVYIDSARRMLEDAEEALRKVTA